MSLLVPVSYLKERIVELETQLAAANEENSTLHAKIRELESRERRAEDVIRADERKRIVYRIEHEDEDQE